jgi:hypothetical protein
VHNGFAARPLGALEDLLGGRVCVISNDIHCDRLEDRMPRMPTATTPDIIH